MRYETQELVRLARRYQNAKRAYLLVNPLQGKHMPVRPIASLEMMEALGDKLRRRFPEARLVIGFAETATAIGAAVARKISEDCVYPHTTREEPPQTRSWVRFQEEHSHATDQKLCGDRLGDWIKATPQVIFVDDELSTGRTLRNFIAQLHEEFPELEGKQLVAASAVNRISPQNEALLEEAGCVCEALLRLPEEDYTARVSGFEAGAAEDCRDAGRPPARVEDRTVRLEAESPRTGVRIGDYHAACRKLAEEVLPWLRAQTRPEGNILVLGTEEFMYPALVLARAVETLGCRVVCHATTRSPIGICGQPGYPIYNGYRLDSFYQAGRDTYIYDLQPYDAAVILTDGARNAPRALDTLTAALARAGCSDVLFLSGGNYV